jgi:disulfide bond formation protein DsbB
MTNNELMDIMLQVNKSQKNKEIALALGLFALASLGFGIYHYRRKKDIQKNLMSLMNDFQSLHKKNVFGNSILRAHAEKLLQQRKVIKMLSDKIGALEKNHE